MFLYRRKASVIFKQKKKHQVKGSKPHTFLKFWISRKPAHVNRSPTALNNFPALFKTDFVAKWS